MTVPWEMRGLPEPSAERLVVHRESTEYRLFGWTYIDPDVAYNLICAVHAIVLRGNGPYNIIRKAPRPREAVV